MSWRYGLHSALPTYRCPEVASKASCTQLHGLDHPWAPLCNLISNPVDIELLANAARYFHERAYCDTIVHALTKEDVGWSGPEALCLSCPNCQGLMLCIGAQDVAIAHGYNNLRWTVPQTVTVGSELPLNQLTELMRLECAMAGFTEILTWALLSKAENFGHLRRQDDGATAVSIGNPATAEFEVCRTSLLPGASRHPLVCVTSELRDWTCIHMQRSCDSYGC